MSELTVILDHFSATLFPMLVNLAWQFALLAGCVWLVTRAGWIRSAPTQHMLWVMCVFSPILLICLGFLMPNTSLLLREGTDHDFRGASTAVEDSVSLNRLEEVSYQRMDKEPHVDSTTQLADLQDNVTISSHEENNSLSETQPHPLTTTTPLARSDGGIREAFAGWLSYAPLIVGLFWMAGFGFSLLRLAWGMLGLHKLRKSAKPLTSGPLPELLETLKARMDVRRSVAIVVSKHVHTPISLGLWRPVILLPDNKLRADSPEGLRLVLIHELAHIRRYDVLVNWCHRVLGALCFFHPLFHLASRRLTQAREQICDNWVIRQSGKRGEYAAFLAKLLESATSNGMAHAISLAVIPTKHSVEGRINMVLEPRNSGKTSLSRKSAAVVLLLGMALVILLSATRILPMPSSAAQAQDSGSQSSAASDGSANIKPDTSLLLSSEKVGGAAISEQASENDGDRAIPAAANPDPISVTLIGTVYREDGITPFAGAWVYTPSMRHKPIGGGGRYFGPVQTDALGNYELSGLPTQRMQVRAFANRMHPDEKVLTLGEQNPTTQDFVLRPAATISGKVTAPGKAEAVYLDFRSGVHRIRSIAPLNPDGSYLAVLAESRIFEIDGVKHYEQAGQENWKGNKTRVPRLMRYRLTARVKGYEAIEIPQVVATRGENTANIDIVATQPTGSISGRVVDEKGNPVPCMELRLVTVKFEDHMGWSSSSLDPKAASQADGSFIFDDVTEGYHQIVPLSPFGGSTPEGTSKYSFRQKQVVVPRAQAVTGVEIVVKPSSIVFITGRILKSDGETPIVNRKIGHRHSWIQGSRGGSGSSSLYTDNEGCYVLRHNEGGIFHLTMILNGASIERKVEAKDGEHIKGVDFVMPDAPDRDGGYVRAKSYVMPRVTDRNIIRGRVLSWDDKQPIGDLSVTLIRQGKPPDIAEERYFVFAGDGYFQSFGMADGEYTVKVERTYNEFMPSNTRLLPQSIAYVTVRDGISDEVTIYLLRGGSVSGKVSSAQTGEPITKARLQWTNFGDMDIYGGEYELHELEPGIHAITIEADGYSPMKRTIELAIGKNVADFDFPLQPIEGQGLAGVVLLSNGKPASNVMISLFELNKKVTRSGHVTYKGGSLRGSQTNSPDGRFQFDDLPPGEYKATLNAVGFPEQVHALEIAEEPITDLKLQLLRGGGVSGGIIAPEGGYLPEEPVILVGTAKGGSANSKDVSETSYFPSFLLPGDFRRYAARPSEPDLRFRIENILPGEYWIDLWENTPQIISLDRPHMRVRVMLPERIEVKEGAETQVELRLPGYGKIEGSVVNTHTGAPFADATVLAVNGEYSVFSRGAVSDTEGNYSIQTISGKYERMEVATRPSGDVHAFETDGFSVEKGQTVRIDLKLMVVSLETIIEGARANDSLVKSGMGRVEIKRMPALDGEALWDETQEGELYGVGGDAKLFYAFEGEKIRLDEEETVYLSNGKTDVMRSRRAFDGERSEALYYTGRGWRKRSSPIPDTFDLRFWGLTVYGVPVADFLQGDTDREHLKAISVVVLGDEQVNGDRCHVVKAIVPGGIVTLWISPDKGYRIRKIKRGSSVALITLRRYADDIWCPGKVVTKHYTFDDKSKEHKLSSEQEITISEDFEINIDVPDGLFDVESDSGAFPSVSDF